MNESSSEGHQNRNENTHNNNNEKSEKEMSVRNRWTQLMNFNARVEKYIQMSVFVEEFVEGMDLILRSWEGVFGAVSVFGCNAIHFGKEEGLRNIFKLVLRMRGERNRHTFKKVSREWSNWVMTNTVNVSGV